MKIYVVGNCQATQVSRALAVMHPALAIETLPWTIDAVETAAEDDLIFRQRNARVPWMLGAPRRNEFLFPRLWFNGFHPDLVMVDGPWGMVDSPLAFCHSSLAIYGWLGGLSVSQTVGLFTESVFEKLNFFGYWHAAQRVLLDDGEAAGLPLDALLAQWRRHCFMHTVNHPKFNVTADIALALSQRARLPAVVETPAEYLTDVLLDGPVWPVYPEVGDRLGLRGAYAFKVPKAAGAPDAIKLLGLEEFIAASFEIYARYDPGQLSCERLESPLYRDLERAPAIRRAASNGASGAASPYDGLPAVQYWRSAIQAVPSADVDPAGAFKFSIDRNDRIATAGSCFAQHVSRTLERERYNFYLAEPSEAAAFSARYGNIYTARQLLQLFDRAFGGFVPRDEAWVRPDGRFVDPFRPRIEPAGFAGADEVARARELHLTAVRTMFEELDVLVFTLGLTEAWRSRIDGAVFPLAPGVIAGRMDRGEYAFCNFGAAEVTADLHAFLGRLQRVNPAAKVVLTVSPVPLIATFEQRHVLVSTTYSKSVLRVAAEEVERAHPHVSYFPAYEIVTGAFNRGSYFEPDLRSVTPEGVAHVMRLFLAHCGPREPDPVTPDALLLAESRSNMEIDCDEETIGDGTIAGRSPLQSHGRPPS